MKGKEDPDSPIESVRLPHTCKTTPYNYFDESIYQTVCGYRKRLDLTERGGRRVFVCFGAAAHHAKIYLNGELIGEHKGGLYIRTKGSAGRASVTLSAEGCESVTLGFNISAI